ncbi:GDSL esterase/lipase At4g10955-like [Fagus crenata]
MANEGDNFYLPSLSPLITVDDWGNKVHRRTVTAILVEVAYMLEHHRQKYGHDGPQLDLSWLEKSYYFQLDHPLIDTDEKNATFGAIFKYIHPNPARNSPQYVIALRGTILKSDTSLRDIILNIKCALNKLHHSPRFQVAMQNVERTFNLDGAPTVWLAGHSLGSAIALLAGKKMAKMGYNLETYLFNPPFLSPSDIFKYEWVNSVIRQVNSVCKASLSKLGRQPYDDPFDMLSNWVPYLFVNPHDPICGKYIGYFEHRITMKKKGHEKVERRATKTSLRSQFSRKIGYSNSEADEPLHLLPSADLTINRGPKQKIEGAHKIKGAHGIEQWWNPYMKYEFIENRYNTKTFYRGPSLWG